MALRGPHAVSFEFRYSVYLPVMGAVWDSPAGFNPHSPLPGFLAFEYYGA